MKKLYLHIGLHKTGTTALQYFFWKNRAALKSFGVLYPEIGLNGGFSHGPLANVIKPNNRDERKIDYQIDFFREINNSEEFSVLLSSEVFLEGVNIADAVGDFIEQGLFDVKIIVYLRNQLDWIQSVYNEVIRDPFRRYTGDIYHLREYESGYLEYDKVLQPWSQRFGDDALILRPYDEFRSGNEIFHDFLRVIGIKDSRSFDFSVNENNQNRRIHPLATEFLRRLNRFAMMKNEYFMIVEELKKISPSLYKKYKEISFDTIPKDKTYSMVKKYSDMNRDLFQKYTRQGGVTLFEKFNINKEYVYSQEYLTAEVQHFIFNNLGEEVQQFLESLIEPVRKRTATEPFLQLPPKDNETRLNEVILRQRFELRKLYEMLDHK